MPKAFKDCVRKVSQQKGSNSAYAICTASNAGNIKEYRKKETLANKAKGKNLGG